MEMFTVQWSRDGSLQGENRLHKSPEEAVQSVKDWPEKVKIKAFGTTKVPELQVIRWTTA